MAKPQVRDPDRRAYLEARLASLLSKLSDLERFSKLALYQPGQPLAPTDRQREFHALGAEKRIRMLAAGNQTGKTFCAGMEVSMHMTGRYPDWWEGHTFPSPQLWWAAGITSESTRDNPQRILLGEKREWGTGTIPRDALHGTPTMKRGIPDAVDSFQVRWGGGGDVQQVSTLWFKSYDQDRTKWQGATLHGIWMDEEPPWDIYDEAIPRLSYHQGILLITFTPLLGMSDVCKLFFEPSPKDEAAGERGLVLMDLQEATFYSEEQRRSIEASYPEHMRRARARGLPSIGEGLIYPVPDEQLSVEPFPIPDWYRRIAGIDFGIDHPTACCLLAWNPETDVWYIYDTYKETSPMPLLHATSLLRKGCDTIPVAWPHDGLKRIPQQDIGSAVPMVQLYRDHGLNMLPLSARYDPDTGGAQPREPIIAEVLELMQTGRLKVFSTCQDWFREKNQYHRKGGKPVDYMDDLMSAMHYALMSRLWARSTVEEPALYRTLGDYDPLTYTLPQQPGRTH